jgi:hypothetical protein
VRGIVCPKRYRNLLHVFSFHLGFYLLAKICSAGFIRSRRTLSIQSQYCNDDTYSTPVQLLANQTTMEETDLEKGVDTPVLAAGQVTVVGAAEEKPSATADAGRRSRRNLYDEVLKAMSGAFLMFVLADIRDMARSGELKSDDHPEYVQRLIDLPIDAFEFITLYRESKEVIQKRIDSTERYEMYASFFELPEDADAETVEQQLRSIQFLHFSDSNAEEECVFGLSLNHLEKKVMVAFRGSVTTKDFTQDAKVRLRFCLFRDGEITHAQYFCGSFILDFTESISFCRHFSPRFPIQFKSRKIIET